VSDTDSISIRIGAYPVLRYRAASIILPDRYLTWVHKMPVRHHRCEGLVDYSQTTNGRCWYCPKSECYPQ
jgi:hypothetical protein